jgi:ATP-binding protein involved in chromosome partitioning
MEANAIREFLTDTVWGSLDFLLLDLPPGTDRLATVAGILPRLSGAVIVTIPSEVSHLVVKKSITVAKACKVPILGLIENMAGYVCQKCGEIGELFPGPGGAALADEFDIPFLGKIPFDPMMAVAADQGIPYVMERHASSVARAFSQIVEKLGPSLG